MPAVPASSDDGWMGSALIAPMPLAVTPVFAAPAIRAALADPARADQPGIHMTQPSSLLSQIVARSML